MSYAILNTAAFWHNDVHFEGKVQPVNHKIFSVDLFQDGSQDDFIEHTKMNTQDDLKNFNFWEILLLGHDKLRRLVKS